MQLKLISTLKMVAGVGTKALDRRQFEFCRDVLNGYALAKSAGNTTATAAALLCSDLAVPASGGVSDSLSVGLNGFRTSLRCCPTIRGAKAILGWGRAQRTLSVGERVSAGCPLVPTDTCPLECPGGETREKEGVLQILSDSLQSIKMASLIVLTIQTCAFRRCHDRQRKFCHRSACASLNSHLR